MDQNNRSDFVVHPHDKVFKTAMEDMNVARDFLEHHLPENIKILLDFSTLKIENPTFIEKNLIESACDVLYQLRFKETKQLTYVYLLVEHQSKPDYWLPFRLLKYMCSGYDHHLSQYPDNRQLPVIIPLIFYTGVQSYKHSLNFFDLFGVHKDLAINTLLSDFSLVDLRQIPDDVIQEYRWDKLLCMVMKHIKHRDLRLKLTEIMAEGIIPLLANEGGEKYVLSMITYLISEGEVISRAEFFATIRAELAKYPLAEKKIMTIAEQLRQEGREEAERGFITIAEQLRQEGREEAERGFITIAEQLRQEGREEAEQGFMTIAEQLRQEGREEGRHEGLMEGQTASMRLIAKRLLEEGNDPHFVAKITTLSVEEVEELI